MQHIRPSLARLKKSLAADIDAYLAGGGTVHKLPTGPYPAPRKGHSSLEGYTHDEVVSDEANWRPVPGFPLYRINRAGEVWSLKSRRLMPITVRSRKVRMSTGKGADSFDRVCVDDLVADIFGGM